MERTPWLSVFCVLLCMSLANAVPYSKYGRTCQDIGCLSSEVCVMAEDPCSLYNRQNCGRYPTCKKRDDANGMSCSTMLCPAQKYCKMENGRAKCVDTSSGYGYESAGVSSVNGQRINGDSDQHHETTHTNVNPYSNANAPPPEHHDTGSKYPSNSGYPPYPSNSGSYSGNYPPYPGASSNSQRPSQSSTNSGYPPYPTQNRMPQPGVYQQGYYPSNSAGYPGHNQQPGYPYQYPNNQYPNYYHNNRNFNARRPYGSSANAFVPCISLLGLTTLAFLLGTTLS